MTHVWVPGPSIAHAHANPKITSEPVADTHGAHQAVVAFLGVVVDELLHQ